MFSNRVAFIQMNFHIHKWLKCYLILLFLFKFYLRQTIKPLQSSLQLFYSDHGIARLCYLIANLITLLFSL